ncbi:MAG: hypothetical protein J7J06_03200 [Methanosarcinales archaeon]|nr:hypothetical protein [Methanosarcinales archaeon]
MAEWTDEYDRVLKTVERVMRYDLERLKRTHVKKRTELYTKIVEKLEVIRSSLKIAEPITKDEILPLVEENLTALRMMGGVEAQKECGMRMCEKLIELLHIATFKIRWDVASVEDGAMIKSVNSIRRIT